MQTRVNQKKQKLSHKSENCEEESDYERFKRVMIFGDMDEYQRDGKFGMGLSFNHVITCYFEEIRNCPPHKQEKGEEKEGNGEKFMYQPFWFWEFNEWHMASTVLAHMIELNLHGLYLGLVDSQTAIMKACDKIDAFARIMKKIPISADEEEEEEEEEEEFRIIEKDEYDLKKGEEFKRVVFQYLTKKTGLTAKILNWTKSYGKQTGNHFVTGKLVEFLGLNEEKEEKEISKPIMWLFGIMHFFESKCHFTCLLCNQAISPKLTITGCGHSFCTSCFENYNKDNYGVNCCILCGGKEVDKLLLKL
jgi:hypothetical protein